MEPSGIKTDLSIVVPLYNEALILPELFRRLNSVKEDLGVVTELLFVNDGSTDATLPLIKEQAALQNNVRYISFSRNFGHQNAIMAGLTLASGKAIVLIDGDLQDPPELIPAMYQKFMEGYHVVYASRKERKGESIFKKITAKIFYRILRKITAIDIPLDTGDFRIISSEVAGHLVKMGEKNKFLRGQISWLGFRQTFIKYERQERQKGSSKFTFRKMTRFALDGITSFSNLPLQIATLLGFVFSMVAFAVILYALYSKFFLHRVVTGWTSIMVSSMFLGGIQLLCIGIMGEYISRIATDVKNRPSYIIEETNLEKVEK